MDRPLPKDYINVCRKCAHGLRSAASCIGCDHEEAKMINDGFKSGEESMANRFRSDLVTQRNEHRDRADNAEAILKAIALERDAMKTKCDALEADRLPFAEAYSKREVQKLTEIAERQSKRIRQLEDESRTDLMNRITNLTPSEFADKVCAFITILGPVKISDGPKP